MSNEGEKRPASLAKYLVELTVETHHSKVQNSTQFPLFCVLESFAPTSRISLGVFYSMEKIEGVRSHLV